MKKVLAMIATFIFCYILWILTMFAYSGIRASLEEYLEGIIVCLIVAFVCSGYFIRENAFWLFSPKRMGALLAYLPVYLWNMLKANWNIAKIVLTPGLKINPGIVKIRTDLKSDYALAVLAGCITTTPGTITMDVVEEKSNAYMYIHCIDIKGKNMNDNSIKMKNAYESWIGRFFS